MAEIGLQKRQSVRFSDRIWDELARIAAIERERTQENIGVSFMVRKFVVDGIERWVRSEARAKREEAHETEGV